MGAWVGLEKENGNPARHTGGLAVAHKAWSFGAGHV